MIPILIALRREFIYLWYYFNLQLEQIFPYWVLGMVLGSAVSVFAKDSIHRLFRSIQGKRLGALGIIPASALGIASPLCMYGTIPIAASFAENGMEHDWLAAFMMSSILLNPQLIFYSMALGPKMLMIRIVSCFLCGITTGLRKYPLAEWRGGSIRRIRPSVILLERGQIFDLGGKRFFTMGGASSHDIQDGILEPDDPLFKKKCRELDTRGAMYRVNHLSWWKNELPSEDEYQTARASLDRAGWEVDYILTHCCPTSVQDIFSGGLYQRDALTEFFDEIRQRCQFKYWFFGHYHENMVIEKKYAMLYEQIIRLKL